MDDFYSTRYKKIVIVPIIMLIPILFIAFVMPGVQEGIDLTGGNVLMIRSQTPVSTVQIEQVIEQEFNLQEVKVSAISSPGTNGAYIQYNKSVAVIDAGTLIEKAQIALDAEKEEESMKASIQATTLLGKTPESYSNAKLALNAAQEALIIANEAFAKNLETVLRDKLGLESTAEFSRREISASLGEASLGSAVFLAISSAVALVIIIFLFFRQIIPVAGIVLAMGYDVLAGMAGMALFGIPLSLLTIATLLMVVGYSVDTDIMLASRMLKEKEGTPGQRATSSVKTGLTMNATTLAALVAMIGVSAYYQIDVVFQIAIILIFGIFGDIIATWLMNVPILMWFTQKVRK